MDMVISIVELVKQNRRCCEENYFYNLTTKVSIPNLEVKRIN